MTQVNEDKPIKTMVTLPFKLIDDFKWKYRIRPNDGAIVSDATIKRTKQGYFCPVNNRWQPKYIYWVSQWRTEGYFCPAPRVNEPNYTYWVALHRNETPDKKSLRWTVKPVKDECMSLEEARRQVTILWHTHIDIPFLLDS